MSIDLILGTAGHIDHGKTSLIRALTGIDCDRLPEEKKRGITIDIGFAHLDLGDYHVGIIDVPGHERFIKNMLAGSSGIDLGLLVVSASESIMPQTREHLEILRLLRIKNGVIALTKIDLVDETTTEVVELEVRELVQGSFLEHAAIVPTSTVTGSGLARLRQEIVLAASQVVQAARDESFRMPIDRSFIVQGHGTVVTGTVHSGTVRAGDTLELLPEGEPVRIRSLQHHDQPVEEVHRGQRAAINLVGVSHERVARGHELAEPGYLVPSRIITVQLKLLAGKRQALKHRTPVRCHIGTAEIMAHLSLLESDELTGEREELAQLFCEEAVTAVWGQPLVLRDSSSERTLGGGWVVQPVAEKIRRRHQEMIEHLHRLTSTNAEERLAALAWVSGYRGFTAGGIYRNAGIPLSLATELLLKMQANNQLIAVELEHRQCLLEVGRLAEIEERVLTCLARLHQENPLLTTLDRHRLCTQLDFLGNQELVQAVIDRLLKVHKLAGNEQRIARTDFKPKLSANQRKLKEKIVEAHREAGFQPPAPATFAPLAAGNASALNDIFAVAVAEGFLVKIADDLFLHAEVEARLRSLLLEQLQLNPDGITVAQIRDTLQTTRKFGVPICEYLDRIGFTERQGDVRLLKKMEP